MTYFKDEVGVIIDLAHTVTFCIYRITNITITFDLHTEEKNMPAIHYQEGTGICFQASTSTSGADLGGAQQAFFTCQIFLEPYIGHWPLCQYYFSSYIDLKCLLFVCVTVKILFDNTSICKYSIILTLCSVAMLLHAFATPHSKILDLPLNLS